MSSVQIAFRLSESKILSLLIGPFFLFSRVRNLIPNVYYEGGLSLIIDDRFPDYIFYKCRASKKSPFSSVGALVQH